jgi:hypothetical protein
VAADMPVTEAIEQIKKQTIGPVSPTQVHSA